MEKIGLKEYRREIPDRANWGEGPWNDEVDKATWVDPETYVGVGKNHPFYRKHYGDCLEGHDAPDPRTESEKIADLTYNLQASNANLKAGRNVMLPRETPHKCWEHSPESEIEVHGGITFSDSCQETGDPAEGICHVPLEGREPEVWWFGFDTSHANDLSPALEASLRKVRASKDPIPEWPNTYKDREYVEAEVKKMADQLWKIADDSERARVWEQHKYEANS